MSRKLLFCAFCLAISASFPGEAAQKGQGKDAEEGKKLFADHCSICHYTDSTNTKVGPGLKGLFHRAKLATGAKMTEENVRKLIENGHGEMPTWKGILSTEQIDDIIAYLKTL